MRIGTFLILFVITYLNSKAQDSITITGIIKDSTGQLIIGANVSLITGNTSLHQATDINGTFRFVTTKIEKYTIKVSILGYNTLEHTFHVPKENNQISISPLILYEKTNTLKEVVIKGQAQIMTLKEDTIEYKISQFKLRENAVVEDLLKRLPGISVDEEGNISFMGNPISKIRINGRDFTVSKLQDLTQIMSIDMLDKVQLIDDYGITAGITGRKIGQPDQILNLQTKSELKNNNQIKLTTGGGFSGKYTLSLFGAILKEKDELFTTVTSSNSEANFGETINSNLNTTYSHISKHLKSQISLSANKINSKINTTSNQQTLTSDGTLIFDNNNTQQNNSSTYAIKLLEDYQLHTIGKLYFSASGYLNSPNNKSTLNSIQTGIQQLEKNTTNDNNLKNSEINVGLLYVFPFKKENRSLILNINGKRNWEKGKQLSYNKIKYFIDSLTVDSIYNISINKDNIADEYHFESDYVEPLNKNSSLEMKYGLFEYKNHYDLKTFQFDKNGISNYIDSLSNRYNYSSYFHYMEINYKKSFKHLEYIIGLTPRFIQIKSRPINLPSNTWQQSVISPFLQLIYKPKNNSYIKLGYINFLNLPEHNQIQPVPDRTNFQSPIVGNPNLKASTNNDFSIEYRTIGKIICQINLKMNIIQNQIVSNTILIKDSLNSIIQETHFLNSDGNFNTSMQYNISKQINEGKYSISFNGNNGYSSNIYYMNSQKEISKNFVLTEGIRLGIFQKKYELMNNIEFNYNGTRNNIEKQENINYHNWMIRIDGKYYFSKNWTVGININQRFNSNVSNSKGKNPLILGAKVEKSVWTNQLIFRLQGYNLLNQESNFSQNVTANTITRSTSNMVGSFLLFSVIFNIKDFNRTKAQR